jgi:hypothetical protein
MSHQVARVSRESINQNNNSRWQDPLKGHHPLIKTRTRISEEGPAWLNSRAEEGGRRGNQLQSRNLPRRMNEYHSRRELHHTTTTTTTTTTNKDSRRSIVHWELSTVATGTTLRRTALRGRGWDKSRGSSRRPF